MFNLTEKILVTCSHISDLHLRHILVSFFYYNDVIDMTSMFHGYDRQVL